MVELLEDVELSLPSLSVVSVAVVVVRCCGARWRLSTRRRWIVVYPSWLEDVRSFK